MDFSSFFCFRMGAISRKMTRYYNNQLAPYGITITQAWVLFFLANRDSSSLKDIAAALQLDSPVVTGLVDRLAKEELLIRQEDPLDRRSLRISLTARGSKLVSEITPAVIDFNNRVKGIVQTEDAPGFERALAALEREL